MRRKILEIYIYIVIRVSSLFFVFFLYLKEYIGQVAELLGRVVTWPGCQCMGFDKIRCFNERQTNALLSMVVRHRERINERMNKRDTPSITPTFIHYRKSQKIANNCDTIVRRSPTRILSSFAMSVRFDTERKKPENPPE